jgi:prolyl-tRNA synthetase
LGQSGTTYLTEKFSAADICVSIWLVMTMEKCKIASIPDKASAWATTTLTALKTYSETVGKLCGVLGGGSPAAAPAAAASSGTPAELADNALILKLNEFGLDFEAYSHTSCMTAEELVENVKLPSEKETHTKNLFFKDKKHGLFLVVHAISTTMNTKQLGKLLKLEGKVNMRLADAAFLEEKLQVKPGCVGPLCIVNDSSKEVKLVLDKALMDYNFVHSHPLRNDASVKLTPAVLQEYLSKAGVEPAIVDFSTEGGGGGGAPKPKAAAKPKQAKEPAQSNKKKNKEGTLLALQWKKDENFAQWYSDVIVLSEMISYYDISGCYILRPWSYKVWDLIQQWFNEQVGRFCCHPPDGKPTSMY